jgi:hypothetical protein
MKLAVIVSHEQKNNSCRKQRQVKEDADGFILQQRQSVRWIAHFLIDIFALLNVSVQV